MKNTTTYFIIIGALLISPFILYCVVTVSYEEFCQTIEELFQTILGLAILVVIFLIGWANADSPVDRSRDTIEWEQEQERKAKQEEEEEDLLRQMHDK